VKLLEPSQDPVFIYRYHEFWQIQPKLNAEAVRSWAKFLALGPAQATIQVPHISGLNFFIAILLNPTSFVYAKQFLSSQA
jgi:hypothetical protein